MKSTTRHPTRPSLGKPSCNTKALEVINSIVATCSKCSFSQNHKPLDILPSLDSIFYLFVGDYPTMIEDIVIKPLADKEGRVLRDIISSYLPPEKYLVVNSVICTPYNGKLDVVTPTLEQQLTCSCNLLDYIKTLKPTTIFSLGKLPAKLLKKLAIPFVELPSQDAVFASDLQKQRFRLLLTKNLELQGNY
jgi:hypothetical protein